MPVAKDPYGAALFKNPINQQVRFHHKEATILTVFQFCPLIQVRAETSGLVEQMLADD